MVKNAKNRVRDIITLTNSGTINKLPLTRTKPEYEVAKTVPKAKFIFPKKDLFLNANGGVEYIKVEIIMIITVIKYSNDI